MINHIQMETKESVQMMAEESRQVVEGLKETEEANQAFRLISQSMKEVSDKVVEVSASVEQMMAASNQILDNVKKSEAISEKNAENSQESAAATARTICSIGRSCVLLHSFYPKWQKILKSLFRSLKL